jgi:protein-S-isoprenylcysteine O-methyltransferase Ste14
MILRLRLALIVLGVAAFTVAQQTGREWIRWVGIVLVASALLLRFLKR